MYYVNGKQVKEMLMKGSDGFLHRVAYGYLSNQRKFYGKDVSYESPLVDVCVYYKGNRVLTTPQFIKRSDLGTTTITVKMTPTVDLKVSNATQSGVINFSGSSGKNPTFKLSPSVIGSKQTTNVYLLDNPSPESSWADTHSYSIIFNAFNFSSISSSAIGRDCGFDNAAVYARTDSGTYELCPVGGLSINSISSDAYNTYLNINFIDPQDVSSVFSGPQSLVHFGYLPETTATAMGFTSTENPNGVDKESSDYYGWGCWAEGEQWLWSDDELCEIFSSNGGTILQSDLDLVTNGSDISYGDILHWGVYEINTGSVDITEITANPVFNDGWIFERDSDNHIASNIYSLENKTLSQAIEDARNIYGELLPGCTIIMIIPYSQESQNSPGSSNHMGDFLAELIGNSMISDFSTYVNQFFNINTEITNYNYIDGSVDIQVSADNGYLYCSENFVDSGVLVATPQSSQTLNFGNNGTNIIYLGARSKDSTLSMNFGEMSSSDWFSTMINSTRFRYYKLIPFITSMSEGTVQGTGTIDVY